MKSLLKNPRILLWIFFVIISIIVIAPKYNPQGIVIKSVDIQTAPGITVGDILYFVNGEPATNELLSKEYNGIVKLEMKSGTRYINANGTLGISGDKIPSTNIRFGLDINGGVRAVLEPNVSTNATIEQIISTLETRINVYGLRESVFRPVYYNDKGYVEVSIAGGTQEELRNLIESQGNFEAKIPFMLQYSGNTSLSLDRNYPIAVGSNSISVNGITISEGETFTLAGIDFTLNKINPANLNITAKVFDGEDVITVFFDPQRSRVDRLEDGYSWTFGVQLSSAGAQKFAWVTQNINSRLNGYLDAPIVFYLDNNLIDSLNIASSLKGRAETEIAISGGAATLQEAVETKAHLQSILRSGALPTTVEIVQLDTVSPSLGNSFLRSAVLAGFVALLGVITIISIRYRRPKLVLPMIVISVTEILIVLGISVLINWTIDLPSIAGILAAVGTGVNDQIIILDRTLRKEEEYEETMSAKIKKAFFVVFGTAGTVIAAMLPLLFTGFGFLTGFALVTIAGVLIGIFITRPAYGIIVEYLTK